MVFKLLDPKKVKQYDGKAKKENLQDIVKM